MTEEQILSVRSAYEAGGQVTIDEVVALCDQALKYERLRARMATLADELADRGAAVAPNQIRLALMEVEA